MNRKILTLFGSGFADSSTDLYHAARLIGKTVAELDWSLCNGGYGGIMEASARGAVEAGGHTIGVTCTRFGRPGPNPYIQQEIPTSDLLQRLNTLIQLGRAYLVLPGGTGTLAELALTWEMKNKGLLEGDRPLLLYGSSWSPILTVIQDMQPEITSPQAISSMPELREILSNLDI